MKKINLIEWLSRNSHEKQKPQRFGRYAVMLIMLLTLGVGQMWAADETYGNGKIIYLDISNGSTTDGWRKNQSTESYKIKMYYADTDNNGDIIGFFCGTRIGTTNIYYATTNNDYVRWVQAIRAASDCGDQHNYSNRVSCASRDNNNQNCISLPSGNATWWNTWVPEWTTYAPPLSDVSFSDNGTAILAGEGTEMNPYLIATGATIKVVAGGTKEVDDSNATIWYDIKDNTTSKQNSSSAACSFTASATANTVYQMKVDGYTKVSSTSSTTLTSDIIYYETVSVKDISVYIYVGDCTDDQKNNLVLEGTPYIGTSAQPGVHIESAGFTTEGNWKKYTFSSITKVHNLHVAGFAGANPLPNIEDATENFYYRMYTGTELADKCIPAPSLTWTTAPADGYVADGNMTAVVNTTPVSGGSPSVTWSTSNSGIANVNENTGEISYVAAGSATITAHVSWSATGDYCAGSQDLAQTITVSTPVVPTVTDASFTNNPIYTWEWVKISFDYASIPDGSYYKIKGGDGYYRDKNNLTNIPISGEGTENFEAACDQVNMINGQTWVVEIYNSSNAKITERTVGNLSVTNQAAVLGSITLSPNTTQNYAGSPIDITMSVTSTYLPNPVVIFYVTDNSNSTTYEVVATTGAIGSRTSYSTTHTATFSASHAATYSVTAKVFSGKLVENFEVADKTTWEDVGGGSFSTVSNLYKQARNGSNHVKQITPNGEDWKTALTKTTSAWNNYYQYIHAKMYYQGGTDLRWKINDTPTELVQTIGATSTWQDVAFNNSGRATIDFMYPFVKGQTNVFYVDDIILSTEASMTARATQSTAATITVRDTYNITYKDQGNVAFSGSHVDTPSSHPTTHTYGTATTLNSATKTGYTFGGWFDNSACTGVAVTSIASSAAKDTTLYAKWTANTYTVQYNANGGTGDAMGNSDLTYNAGALSTNTYTRAGYTFSGWNTDANGSGVPYTDGQTNPNVSTTNGATVTLYAQWAARPYKIVYFAMPQGWTNVYAYTWYSSNTSKHNATFPGVQLNNGVAGTGSVIENGVTYYYYKFYTDGLAGDSEGDGTGYGNSPNTWDRVIFANSSSATTAGTDKTNDLNISTGHYYWLNDATNSTGKSSAPKWIVKGGFPDHDWNDDYAIVFAENARSGSVLVEGLTASTSYKFKIWRDNANGEWYKYTGGASSDYYDDRDITSEIGTELTLRTYVSNDNKFTAATTSYRFLLDVTNINNPVLTVVPGDDANYSVTVETNGHGSISQGTGAKTIHQYAPTTLTAVADPGYRFTGWSVDGDHSSNVTISPNASSSTVTVTGVAGASGATITANFSNTGFVYFDRTAVNGTWTGDKVYMTCLNSSDLDWDGTTGTLVVKNWVHDDVHNQEMHRIPNSNIYYFDCTGHLPNKILFTDKTHPHGGGNNYYKLYDMGAVVEWEHVDLSYDNMYVIENYTWQSKNKTGYFEGYWMKYNETSSGIELQVFDEAQKAIAGSPVTFTTTRAGDRQFEASISLSAATGYNFKVKGFNGRWYGNSGTMTNTNCTGWDFLDRVNSNCYFRTTGAGSYKFTLNCTDAGKLKVSLEFPLDVNDYRVVYQGKVKEGGSATHHPSEFIRHLSAAGERKDTISFYVREDWSLQLQQCSAVSPSVTWGNVGAAITKASLGITENGVYTFYVTQTHNGTTNTVTIEKGEAYTGNYYIRSSAAGGGWEAYQTTPDNKLVHSDFAKVHSGYDYYHCHYVTTGQNVKFCIANDYSTNITDTLDNDTYVTSYGNLPYECSVRFMYNNAKNTISRAYLNGSYDGSTKYLALYSKAGASTDSIKNIDGSAIAKSEGINHVKFQDMGNWVYQKDIQALPGTRVRLISNYRFSNTDHLQYFKGSAGEWSASTTDQLIGGTTSDWQKLRLVYDFKTNHLIGAWLVPDGNVPSGGLTINADVMIIRTDQGDAEQITFGNPADKLDKVNVIYSTLHLTYNHIANKKKTDNTTDSTLTARSQREYYWVSFPYDVKIEDIFGSVGEFNNEWGIMYYDGKERAEKGYWADSESFWKYFPDRSATLKAFEGYVVGVDIDMVGQAVDKGKWVNGVRDVYLYFPSDTARSIVNRDTTITIDQEGYECTIDRRTDKTVPNVDKDRRIADSYWHCIGVPSFHNVSHTIKNNWIDPETGRDVMIPNISDWETPDVPYLYVWNPVLNNYTPQAATSYTFKAMHSYMVQYNRDTIKWSAVAAPEAPAAIAARKVRKMENGDIEWRIDLMRDDESQDRTYVRMSNDESVTSGFEFNYDLTKELNANKANIYTFADYVPVAGNMMPMSTTETTIVPVGVKIPANGLYTFTMPEGTEGVGVVLIDNIAGTRTNLALEDYTVNLTAGKIENRFFFEISPIVQSPTDIEHTSSDSKDGVRKVMVDGVLYIVKEGVVFDACGNRVK